MLLIIPFVFISSLGHTGAAGTRARRQRWPKVRRSDGGASTSTELHRRPNGPHGHQSQARIRRVSSQGDPGVATNPNFQKFAFFAHSAVSFPFGGGDQFFLSENENFYADFGPLNLSLLYR